MSKTNNSRRITISVPFAVEQKLKPLVEAGVFRNTGDALLHGGKVIHYLSTQANEGFDHVVVRNDVGAERTILLPELTTVTKEETEGDE